MPGGGPAGRADMLERSESGERAARSPWMRHFRRVANLEVTSIVHAAAVLVALASARRARALVGCAPGLTRLSTQPPLHRAIMGKPRGGKAAVKDFEKKKQKLAGAQAL